MQIIQAWLTSLASAGGWVLKASVQGSVLILIVFAVQMGMRGKLAPRWQFALWYLVLARLLLPVFPESTLSIFNLAPARPVVLTRDAKTLPVETGVVPSPVPWVSHEPVADSTVTSPWIAPSTFAQPRALANPPAALVTISQVLAMGWLLGILLLAGRVILSMQHLSRRLLLSRPIQSPEIVGLLEECRARMGVKRQIRIFASDQFQSPCLVGFLKPRLLLPAKFLEYFTERELRMIFLHELAHVKRRDILINWLCTVAQIVHWFNPLVWTAFNRMRAQREVACDALALTVAGQEERKAYGDTIIRLLEGFASNSPVAGSVGILEDSHQIKERIHMIARFRLASRWSVLAAPLLGVIGLFCLTDAQVAGPGGTPPANNSVIKVANPKMFVTVVNEREEPIANVPLQANYFTEDDLEGHDVVTDAQGIARIPPPNHPEQPIRGMNLWVASPNHEPRVVRWNQYNIPVEYKFTLNAGKKLSGIVVNAKGQPVPAVHLRISSPGITVEHDEQVEFHPRFNKIITDGAGQWSCSFIPAGFKELRFVASHTDYAVTEKSLTLPAALDEENRIVLDRANSVLGRVLSDTGEPIAGARVRQVHSFGWRKIETKTDNAGNFLLQGLRKGPSLIVVQADGRAPEGRTVEIESDVNGVEFRLEKGFRFAGRVVDQSGQPVAHVELGTSSDNQGLKKVEFETHTDTAGRFEWNSGPDGTLLFYVRGKGIRFRHGLSLTPGEHEIIVAREERDHILITGRVVDAKTGEPVPKFHVTVGETFAVAGNVQTNWTSLGTDGHVGEFQLPIGKLSHFPQFALQVTAPGYFPVVSTNLTIASGDQALEFRLPKGVSLAGTVVFPDGRPIAGVSVFLCGARSAPYMDRPGKVRDDMGGYSTSTRADGSFRLDPIAQQHSVVVVHPDGYLEIPVTAFEQTNRFVLQPYGRVEGTLYVNGKPAAGETITVTSMLYRYGFPGKSMRDAPAIHVYLNAMTDRNGKFFADKIPPGERQIWQVLPRTSNQLGPIMTHHQTFVEVRPGETSRVDLGLGGKKVVGRIVLKGAPENFDWTLDVQRLEPKAPIPNRPLEQDFAERKDWFAARQKWGQADRQFWQSEEGYEFARTHRKYCAVFDENGGFVINDVLPGPYTFAIRLTHKRPEEPLGPSQRPFMGQLIKTGFADVIVPSGEGNGVVDMGDILLEAKQPTNRAPTE